jgi:hypothetical protein
MVLGDPNPFGALASNNEDQPQAQLVGDSEPLEVVVEVSLGNMD